jgi:hypothetical protein
VNVQTQTSRRVPPCCRLDTGRQHPQQPDSLGRVKTCCHDVCTTLRGHVEFVPRRRRVSRCRNQIVGKRIVDKSIARNGTVFFYFVHLSSVDCSCERHAGHAFAAVLAGRELGQIKASLNLHGLEGQSSAREKRRMSYFLNQY